MVGELFFKKPDPPRTDNSDSPVPITDETRPSESTWKGKGTGQGEDKPAGKSK